MKYLALIFLAAVLAVITGQGCAHQDAVVARVTVDITYEALTKAYALESYTVEKEDCEEYTCISVYQCDSLKNCPAQNALEARWLPIWTSYETLATAVELGDSDSARASYCKLRVAAGGIGVNLPIGVCKP